MLWNTRPVHYVQGLCIVGQDRRLLVAWYSEHQAAIKVIHTFLLAPCFITNMMSSPKLLWDLFSIFFFLSFFRKRWKWQQDWTDWIAVFVAINNKCHWDWERYANTITFSQNLHVFCIFFFFLAWCDHFDRIVARIGGLRALIDDSLLLDICKARLISTNSNWQRKIYFKLFPSGMKNYASLLANECRHHFSNCYTQI